MTEVSVMVKTTDVGIFQQRGNTVPVSVLSQVLNIRKVLKRVEKPQGLYPNFLSPVTGNWVQRRYQFVLRVLHGAFWSVHSFLGSNCQGQELARAVSQQSILNECSCLVKPELSAKEENRLLCLSHRLIFPLIPIPS